MITRHDSDLTLDVLRWLVHLPFLSADDLALLTGQPEPDVAGALHELTRAGAGDAVPRRQDLVVGTHGGPRACDGGD